MVVTLLWMLLIAVYYFDYYSATKSTKEKRFYLTAYIVSAIVLTLRSFNVKLPDPLTMLVEAVNVVLSRH